MRAIGFLAMGICLWTASWTKAVAGEERISIDQLPKTVAEAAKKRFPDAKIVSASKESEDKQPFYEVSLTQVIALSASKEAPKTRRIDLLLTPEGAIKEIETEMAEKDLPDLVRRSLKQQYPDASIRNIEEITKVKDGKESLEAFEVLLTATDKSILEVKFSALEKDKGKVLKVEKKSGKDDDDDDDKEDS